MATYKVIQDIEAEDKLLGPLTLRQFVYAGIVAVSGFIGFKLAVVHWYLALPLLPHTIFFAVLAAPFGHDQSNEVWLLAKIRFFLKPRRRVWDQSGIKELVTITVPKRIERHLTNGLGQDEVRSRLSALANTIDSRGWAIKNVNINLFSQPVYVGMQGSDRLVDPSSLPQEVPAYEAAAMDDILDERSNPTAQHLDQMINASTQAHHQQLVQSMASGPVQPAAAPPNGWFTNQPTGFNAPAQGVPVQQQTSAAIPVLPPVNPVNDHLRIVKPLSDKKQQRKDSAPAKASPEPAKSELPASQPATIATPVNPAILDLANNDDLNVATLARQANKEVVISLR